MFVDADALQPNKPTLNIHTIIKVALTNRYKIGSQKESHENTGLVPGILRPWKDSGITNSCVQHTDTTD